MSTPADVLRLAERTIDVEWSQGAVTPVAKPHTTGWRVLPYLLTAQLVGGRSLIELDGAERELLSGQALCIGAGVRHRITLLSPEPGHSLWSHVHVRLFGCIDLMTLLDAPLILEGAIAERVGGLNRRLAELHAEPDPCLADLIERRRCGFDLLAAVATASSPRPHLLENMPQLQRLAPVLGFIEQNLDSEPLDLPQLARRIDLSPSRFSALFRAAMGVSPSRHVQAQRMRRAETLLIGSDLQVQEIATRSGFSDPFHFSRLFTRLHALSPTLYRERARTAAI